MRRVEKSKEEVKDLDSPVFCRRPENGHDYVEGEEGKRKLRLVLCFDEESIVVVIREELSRWKEARRAI